jgi:hypothetical protein
MVAPNKSKPTPLAEVDIAVATPRPPLRPARRRRRGPRSRHRAARPILLVLVPFGALLEAQEEPCPPLAAIGPLHVAPENPVLRRMRDNRLLDQIRHSDSALQVRRSARLVGDLAAITSTLTMSFADLLFQCMAGDPVDRLRRRYHEALQAVDIIQVLCSDPLVLREWHFSEEHCNVTARLLGAFTGSAGSARHSSHPTRPVSRL